MPQGLRLQIEVIYILEEFVHFKVGLKAQQQPVEFLFIVPLDDLCKLCSHEVELLSGVSVHICDERPHGSKFALHRAGAHFAEQRCLSVNYLIV